MRVGHALQFRGFELTLPFPLLTLVLGIAGATVAVERSIEMALVLAALVAGIALSGSI